MTAYDLHLLGWKAFQDLCLTVAGQVLGQTIESFLDSNDGGRDGAFSGQWTTASGETLSGKFVIQCKFTANPSTTLTLSRLSDEIDKVRHLVDRGLCDVYVLMTNLGHSGTSNEDITQALHDVGVNQTRILDSTWINRTIAENKKLRMLVPRLYGLGDLSQILDARAYNQAHAVLDSMRDDLAKVVITASYRNAVDALNKHGFVLILGEPASGKTTIASLLAVSAIDSWQASVLKPRTPEELIERWNPDERSQFFWIDDAFGTTQFEDTRIHNWNHALPMMHSMLNNKTKIVMTSRDYIYNRARKELKQSAFPRLHESQVVIDIQALSHEEKQRILYNHIKMGSQSRHFRAKIKPFLEGIASHPRFIPEIARRLGNPAFTANLSLDNHSVREFVERREHLLKEIVESLDSDSKAALSLIHMRNGEVNSPITLDSTEEEALELLGSSLGGCRNALNAMNGSLVRLSTETGERAWGFQHPTIGDAHADILAEDPELIRIFIQGTTPGTLIDRVTCGEIDSQNALVLPPSLFPQMLAKLDELQSQISQESRALDTWRMRDRLQTFLAARCSEEFLTLYLARNPRLLDRVSKPGLSLYYSSEVRLAVKLHEIGLLPEPQRRKFVETVRDYTLEGLDGDALVDDRIRSVFTVEELEELVGRVRSEVIPRLADIRWDWESNFGGDESPDDYMQPLFEYFDCLRATIGDVEEVVRAIDDQESRLHDWIGENMPEEIEEDSTQLRYVQASAVQQGTRSIFDDIDVDTDSEGS